MNTTRYWNVSFGIVAATVTFLPLGAAGDTGKSGVPVQTMTNRSDAQIPAQEVRWGRGYYGGPYGYYGAGPRGYYAPRYYSGYRGYGYGGGYGAPYGGYYPGDYYGSRYGYGPGYGGYYRDGGVRVGRVGIFWR